MKKMYLVDVSSMFFRAFYAVRPLHAADGTPVNAVYGFMSMIIKLLKEKNPEYIVFCYDRKEPSFRKDLDQNYKANRTEMPEDLQKQMPYIKQVAGLLGIKDIELPGYEADDVIGTLAKMGSQHNLEVHIVSGDKDFCQLVNDQVFIYDTMKETITTPQSVFEKYGVTPNQFRDYLAITGDTSDNIPGVAGIGPKGAQKLIEQFGTLDGIYENIDKVDSKSVKQKLIDSKNQAFLSQKLVTIVTDAISSMDLSDFKKQPLKKHELRQFLQLLNFKTFEKNILDDNILEKNISIDAKTVNESTDNKITENVLPISSDPNLNINQSDFLTEKAIAFLKSGKSFCFLFKESLFIGCDSDLMIVNQLQAKDFFEQINLTDINLIGYDIKGILSFSKLSIKKSEQLSSIDDLMLKSYLIKGTDCSDISKVIKTFLKTEVDMKTMTPEQLYGYLIVLQKSVHSELDRQPDWLSIYKKLDLPMIKILYAMEKNGVKIDTPSLKSYSMQLESEIKKVEEKIYTLSGEQFNIASPKQLGVVLFEKMNLPVVKKTKTGYSTDNEVLETLDHPIAQELIEYRELTKLKSTYVDTLPELTDENSRVHSQFHQALTATGRFSSTDPNLQNIPIRTPRGQLIRRSFVADSGQKLLCLDYSQIELRVLAHISEDPQLIKAFNDDLDIHTATASEIFSVKLNDVTKDQRRKAKAVNFGIAYGQGAFGLAEILGISRTESKDIIERYFTKYAGIKNYIESTIKSAHEKKYVQTVFGRRRYLPELDSSQVMIKKFGERAAINAPIQGTASDLVKLAMIDTHQLKGLPLILQIHDELMFEGTEADIHRHLQSIIYKMENVAQLKVKLKVNYSIGNNWDESH